MILSSPNAGNPQKVQRYANDWAKALREMARFGAEYLFPGHGLPIAGRERVQQALSETAEYLESLVNQTVKLMNEGYKLNDILHKVKPPEHLSSRPYLQPSYDEPGNLNQLSSLNWVDFVVRNIWRLYGGWWDGNPSNLKPARSQDLANEIAELVSGGAMTLAHKARQLADRGSYSLASHLIELAAESSLTSFEERKKIHEIRSSIYRKMSDKSTSLMARNIYRATSLEEARTTDIRSHGSEGIITKVWSFLSGAKNELPISIENDLKYDWFEHRNVNASTQYDHLIDETIRNFEEFLADNQDWEFLKDQYGVRSFKKLKNGLPVYKGKNLYQSNHTC